MSYLSLLSLFPRTSTIINENILRVPHTDIPRYRNHKGNVSINVLAVCDQHMNFIFVLSDWEGSAADSRILHDSVTRPNGLRVPNDFVMDGKPNVHRGSRGRKRVGSKTRRVWSFVEECELMHSLKDLVVKGNKCDNGFRSGYLLILENWLTAKISGTDLKGEPHINSKIHVWKRQYVCLKSMLGISGVGLNSTTYHVDALPEVWDAQIMVDAFTKSLKDKAFTFYA
ncbi:hypothetical protein ACS0TY_021332 [Phlomoides rotata]